jgi:hypothetical protein
MGDDHVKTTFFSIIGKKIKYSKQRMNKLNLLTPQELKVVASPLFWGGNAGQ